MSSVDALQPQEEFTIPYKHVLIFTVFMCWYGPSTVIFNLVLLSILFGPNKVLPVLRAVVKNTIDESKQLYAIATKEDVQPPDNSSLRAFTTSIKKRLFYGTL